jgi:hypothetical protein
MRTPNISPSLMVTVMPRSEVSCHRSDSLRNIGSNRISSNDLVRSFEKAIFFPLLAVASLPSSSTDVAKLCTTRTSVHGISLHSRGRLDRVKQNKLTLCSCSQYQARPLCDTYNTAAIHSHTPCQVLAVVQYLRGSLLYEPSPCKLCR